MRRAMITLLGALVVLALVIGVRHWWFSTSDTLAEPPEGTLRVASWNVHYILVAQTEHRWGRTAWEARKAPMHAVFKRLEADLVAFQEMESFARGNQDNENLAREWLLAENPAYRAAAIGPWREFPSTQPIFYRTDRLTLEDQGWFFFSETPDVIYSRTFDGSFPAFASWAVFTEIASGARFRVINLHFDAFSRENRRRSAALVAERAAPWVAAGERVVLMGDLNALGGSGLHETLEGAGVAFLDVKGATIHFDRGVHLFGAIDHVALSPGVAAERPVQVLQWRPGRVWPTDHYPIVVDVTFGDPLN